jgi:MYXO-CTERM domain-containing protein
MIKTVLAATALAAFTFSAQAATVVQWNFEGYTAPTAATTSVAGVTAAIGTGVASGVHASAATFSTPAGNGSAKSFSANTWAVGDYWEFSFSTTGYTGLIVSFDQNGSGTGPRDFSLAYSTNGSTFTSFAAYALPPAITWSSGVGNPASNFTMDLSAIAALNNQATVFVRLVDASTTSINAGAVGTGGTDRVDNFTVNLTPVPEADTAAMLLAGLAALTFMARRRRD